MRSIIDNRSTELKKLSQRFFRPDNFDSLIALPYRRKTLSRYKRDLFLLKYLLNRLHVARFINKDEPFVNISNHAMAAICKKDTHTFGELSRFLISKEIIACDFKCFYRSKAYGYRLGKKMQDCTWKLSDERVEFSVLKPQREANQNAGALTVDVALLDQSLERVKAKRDWTDEEAKVWRWFLAEDWNIQETPSCAGRVYGTWARIPRELRGTLLLDGEDTVEPDIKNAQPLLLACLYKGLTTFGEEERYKALVESGRFYEDVMIKTGITCRDATKQMVMDYLCGGSKERVSQIRRYYGHEFPMLFTQIESHQKKLFKNVALILQKLESDIVVKRICEEFSCLSLHDAVLCKKSEGTKIQEAMKRIIWEEYELNARVEIDNKRSRLMDR